MVFSGQHFIVADGVIINNEATSLECLLCVIKIPGPCPSGAFDFVEKKKKKINAQELSLTAMEKEQVSGALRVQRSGPRLLGVLWKCGVNYASP